MSTDELAEASASSRTLSAKSLRAVDDSYTGIICITFPNYKHRAYNDAVTLTPPHQERHLGMDTGKAIIQIRNSTRTQASGGYRLSGHIAS